MSSTGPTPSFTTHHTPPGKLVPLAIDLHHAERLRAALVKAKTASTRWDPVKWANEFRLLRLGPPYGGDVSALSEVLAFYERNAGAKGFPNRVSNAKQFRSEPVQRWLLDLLRKDKDRNLPTTRLGDQVFAVLDAYHWPKGGGAALRHVVEVSLAGYSEFIAKASGYATAAKIKSRVGPLTTSLPPVASFAWSLTEYPYPAAAFVESWFRVAFYRVIEWSEWSGEMGPLAFHPASKEAAKWGRQKSTDWCGRWNLYDLLLSELGYPEVNS